MLERIGENLFSVRKSLGMTQKEAAEKIGITATALSAYEKGKRAPSLEVLCDIAKFYGVSLDLICGIDVKPLDAEGKPFSRADVFRLIATLRERMESVNIKAKEEERYPVSYTQVFIEFQKTNWLKPFCDKYFMLYNMCKNGEIDHDVLDAWKEKQFENNESIEAEDRKELSDLPF